jgi:DNA polymerase-3 subunit delta'
VPAPTLNDILGQQRAVETLRAALAANRVHHAWIFAGPAGVGKFTTAHAFAGALIDPTTERNLSGEIAPDPQSPTQRLLAEGVHPDLHVITKELAAVSDDAGLRRKKQINIPLDLLRERMIGGMIGGAEEGKRVDSLVDKAPRVGARRVFIVDEAHLLDARGQNALLKTLEEPPGANVVILVTDQEDALLPTVRSRCQRIAFGLLDEGAVRQAVARTVQRGEREALAHAGETEQERRRRRISPEESVCRVSKDDWDWAIHYAAGSPGMACLAVAAGLRRWDERLTPLLERTERREHAPALGGAIHGLVEEWAGAQVDEDEKRSKDAANKAGARMALSLIAERSRRALRSAVERGDAAARERSLRALDAVEEASRRINQNVNASLAYDALAAELARA